MGQGGAVLGGEAGVGLGNVPESYSKLTWNYLLPPGASRVDQHYDLAKKKTPCYLLDSDQMRSIVRLKDR